MTILVSACLLGRPCRYDGTARGLDGLGELLRDHTVVPICPESMGGLTIPRPPAEHDAYRVRISPGRIDIRLLSGEKSVFCVTFVRRYE